jgi:DNA invertase Pin-like site-specific DNA recombinase
MQRAAIEKFAAAKGDVVVTWYAEKASAKTIKRPELERLRADAKAGKLRRTYCYKYDRLCRTGVRDLLNVLEDFKVGGCEVLAVADTVDLAGEAAEMILSALAFAARLERIAINDRISSARDALAAKGRGWGRQSTLSDKDRATMQQMKAEGRSIRDISIALKLSKSSVARALGPLSADLKCQPGRPRRAA